MLFSSATELTMSNASRHSECRNKGHGRQVLARLNTPCSSISYRRFCHPWQLQHSKLPCYQHCIVCRRLVSPCATQQRQLANLKQMPKQLHSSLCKIHVNRWTKGWDRWRADGGGNNNPTSMFTKMITSMCDDVRHRHRHGS